jgi:hypothetical protein
VSDVMLCFSAFARSSCFSVLARSSSHDTRDMII